MRGPGSGRAAGWIRQAGLERCGRVNDRVRCVRDRRAQAHPDMNLKDGAGSVELLLVPRTRAGALRGPAGLKGCLSLRGLH